MPSFYRNQTCALLDGVEQSLFLWNGFHSISQPAGTLRQRTNARRGKSSATDLQPGDAPSSRSAANRQRTSTARRSKLLLVRQRRRRPLSGFSYSARRHHLCFSIHNSSSSSSRAVISTHRTYRCRSSSVQLIALTCKIAAPLLTAARRTVLIALKVNATCSGSRSGWRWPRHT